MRKNRDKYYFYEKELRKLVNSWEINPGSPNDEYDQLVHRLLSNLINQRDHLKIRGIIESYITIDLGLFTNEVDLEKAHQEVISWWNKKN